MNIKAFVIYGERNSGTNWLEAILTGKSYYRYRLTSNNGAFNLPVLNSSIDSYCDLTYGHKHFFGFYTEEIKKTKDIVFLGIIRNPYDWLTAIHRDKHHIPKVNYPINKFLTNEWYSINHNELTDDYGAEIMTDRDWDSGLRYKNIFEMRKKKLVYLIDTMPKIAKNYELIRYEDLCDDPLSIVTELSDKYNLCLNMPITPAIKKSSYGIIPDIKKIINENIDWTTESLVGYHIK